MSKWRMLTLKHKGTQILIDLDKIESVRPDPQGTSLYAPKATDIERYLVAEPFELVCAMLTEEPDRPEQARKDIAYLLEAYNYGQFADDMLDHPSPDCRSPGKPLREVLRRHLDYLAREQSA